MTRFEKSKKYKFWITALLLTWVGGAGYAETPTVRAKFSADSVLIGDQFRLEVEVDKDMMEIVEFPVLKQTLGDSTDIEVLGESLVDTLQSDGRRLTLRKEYTLTSFDEGDYHTGKFPVLYVDKNIVDTLWSQDSLRIVVNTIPVDTVKQKIHDVKRPIHTPVRFGEFSGYLAMGLAGLLVVAAIIWLIVKKLRKRPLFGDKKAPDEPPHVTAIKQLEKLHNQKLWQSGKYKQYYTGITDILRQYLASRYPIKAMEMTSKEIIDRMKSESLIDVSMKRLSDTLLTADFVKFAKYVPDADQNEAAYTDAYYFVEETKQSEPVAVEEVQPEAQQKSVQAAPETTEEEKKTR